MAYSKTIWVDQAQPAITATRLNKIEEGIANSQSISEGLPSNADVASAIGASAIGTINTVQDNIDSAILNMQNTVNPQIASINQDISDINAIIPDAGDIINSVNTALSTGAYGLTTNIENVALTAVDGDGRWALSQDLTQLQSVAQTNSQVQATAIQEIQTAVTNLDVASTLYVQTYVSEAVINEVLDAGAVTALANTAITTAINSGTQLASAQDITDLQGDVGANTSAISTLGGVVTGANSAFANSLTTLQSSIGDNDTSIAGLTTAQSTFATDQSALSTSITTLSSNLGTNYITATDTSATYATQAGVNAMRQVALDNNGNITGWTAANGTSGSSFVIQADQFAIANQTQTATPFAIDTITGQAVFNGKVSFTNVTGTGNLAEISDIPTDYVNSTDVGTIVNNALPSDIVTEAGLQAAFNQNVTTIDGAIITTGLIDTVYFIGGTEIVSAYVGAPSSYTDSITLQDTVYLLCDPVISSSAISGTGASNLNISQYDANVSKDRRVAKPDAEVQVFSSGSAPFFVAFKNIKDARPDYYKRDVFKFEINNSTYYYHIYMDISTDSHTFGDDGVVRVGVSNSTTTPSWNMINRDDDDDYSVVAVNTQDYGTFSITTVASGNFDDDGDYVSIELYSYFSGYIQGLRATPKITRTEYSNDGYDVSYNFYDGFFKVYN